MDQDELEHLCAVAAKVAQLGCLPRMTKDQLRAIRDRYIRQHGRVPKFTSYPEPGYWAIRLTKGGVEAAACIVLVHTTAEPGEPTNLMERSPFLAAFIDGEPVDMERVWHTRGREITKAEYHRMVADREWCKKYAPQLPEANPHKRIDFNKIPAPF